MVKKMVNRRAFVAGVLAATVAPATAQIVLRPTSPNTDKHYMRYSLQGDLVGGDIPKMVSVPDLGFRVVMNAPRAPEARLVVFSHDALSDPQAYLPLFSHWASHGFMVVAPVHDDSVIERGLLARRDDPKQGASWEIGRLLGHAEAWQQRASMCSDVLSAVSTLSNLAGIRINQERVIIAGHGFGAYVVQLLLGTKAQVDGGSTIDMPDARFAGGIMFAPQGIGAMGLTAESWQSVERPFLTVLAGKDPVGKADAFNSAPHGYKHLAIEREAVVEFFTGQRASISAGDRERFDDLKAITTAFLLAYVDHDEAAFKDIFGNFFNGVTYPRMDYSTR